MTLVTLRTIPWGFCRMGPVGISGVFLLTRWRDLWVWKDRHTGQGPIHYIIPKACGLGPGDVPQLPECWLPRVRKTLSLISSFHKAKDLFLAVYVCMCVRACKHLCVCVWVCVFMCNSGVHCCFPPSHAEIKVRWSGFCGKYHLPSHLDSPNSLISLWTQWWTLCYFFNEFFKKDLFVFILSMSVLPVFMYVHCVHSWCSRRLE